MMGCSVSVNMLSDEPLTFHWQLEKIFSNKFDMCQNNTKLCKKFMICSRYIGPHYV